MTRYERTMFYFMLFTFFADGCMSMAHLVIKKHLRDSYYCQTCDRETR